MQTDQITRPPTPSSAVTVPAGQRRERRLQVVVTVKVFPDTNSPECQSCCTYEISTYGARLVAPIGVKQVGQTIFLQRHNRRAKYTVVWIGKPETSQAGQVGVECIEPGNVIWENEIRGKISVSQTKVSRELPGA